jgi:hypothetical protein
MAADCSPECDNRRLCFNQGMNILWENISVYLMPGGIDSVTKNQ